MTRAKYSTTRPPEPGQWFTLGDVPMGVPGRWLNTYTLDGNDCRDWHEVACGLTLNETVPDPVLDMRNDLWCYVGPITEPPEPMPALPAGWAWNGTMAQHVQGKTRRVFVGSLGIFQIEGPVGTAQTAPPEVCAAVLELWQRGQA